MCNAMHMKKYLADKWTMATPNHENFQAMVTISTPVPASSQLGILPANYRSRARMEMFFLHRMKTKSHMRTKKKRPRQVATPASSRVLAISVGMNVALACSSASLWWAVVRLQKTGKIAHTFFILRTLTCRPNSSTSVNSCLSKP